MRRLQFPLPVLLLGEPSREVVTMTSAEALMPWPSDDHVPIEELAVGRVSNPSSRWTILPAPSYGTLMRSTSGSSLTSMCRAGPA